MSWSTPYKLVKPGTKTVVPSHIINNSISVACFGADQCAFCLAPSYSKPLEEAVAKFYETIAMSPDARRHIIKSSWGSSTEPMPRKVAPSIEEITP